MKAGNRGQRVSHSQTHIGWRATAELRARWQSFLKTQPPVNKSKFLNEMLTAYLDQAERYGVDPLTLRPRTKK